MKSRNEEIFVKVIRNGYIPQLGICGPIPNPIKITRGLAHSMVVAGIDVYQYFPDTKMTQKMTIHNTFEDQKNVNNDIKRVSNANTNNIKISEPVKPIQLNGIKKENTSKEENANTEVNESEKKVETEDTTVKTEETNQKNQNNNKKHK